MSAMLHVMRVSDVAGTKHKFKRSRKQYTYLIGQSREAAPMTLDAFLDLCLFVSLSHVSRLVVRSCSEVLFLTLSTRVEL